jgi:hypothetical protein
MDEQVGRVLAEVWRGTEGYIFLPAKTRQGWSESAPFRWPAHEQAIFVRPEGGVDNYFSPLVFSEPHRRAEHALPTHVLWADLDEADPRTCALLPSIAWITTQGGITTEGGFCDEHSYVRDDETTLDDPYAHRDAAAATCPNCTKPHWQALWLLGEGRGTEFNVERASRGESAWKPRVARQIIPATEAAELSKRIAYAEPGADHSGWDVTQVLRLPGTLNHKHSPPQKVEMLWAKRLYYTVEQVSAAYPPVPRAHEAGASGWPAFSEDEIRAALLGLPVGVQVAMERDGAADRSLELFKMARELLRFGTPPDMAAVLLERSALGRDKFGSRRDGRERLLTMVADALLSHNKGGDT